MRNRGVRVLSVAGLVGSILFVIPPIEQGLAEEAALKTAPPNTNVYQPSTDQVDVDGCTHKLEKIARAIDAYRKEHKDLPNWISDLVPKYLAATDLICPVTAKTGRLSPFGALDPNMKCSYLYEFPPTAITEAVKQAFPGPLKTTREWKRQEMGIVGSEVPIVRCLLHDPVLNLSFGGSVYTSGLIWEENFLDVAKKEDFNPH